MTRAAPTTTEPAPLRGVKASTMKLLLDTAIGLINERGHIPSIAEVALQAHVSRATAYRYFTTRSELIAAVVNASLAPVRQFHSTQPDGRARVKELFVETFPLFKQFEPQLRAAAQLALEHQALERAGLLEERPYRRGYRVAILEHAMEPLKAQLTPAVRKRLHQALSVVYGIEPYVVMRDILKINDQQIESTALWMAMALVDAALKECRASGKEPSPRTARRQPVLCSVS
ncbi:TetR/AcrR family transcriptional regulator [Variovorax sp. PCZ-1]|uniref:TetR/AcrR family transcriptional regulator n=1 Tax=Variovorax sp. PCZ-1 TaxID=2835533 RepID=UPI001BCBD700|nr:TetR/AcrR family transcriptional regulator [Variovorax sp. PCZ-1]MBS7806021.1 TetR/AcrR family transcriptional regulator [Variovorax sp. PCZ-1]